MWGIIITLYAMITKIKIWVYVSQTFNVNRSKSCKLESFSRYFLVGKSQERVLLNWP